MDLTRSILAVTGTALPPGYEPDGVNILPALSGQAPVADRQLFWRILRTERQQKATRSGRWMLLVDGGQYLLFDLRDDPGERHDLAAQHPDLVDHPGQIVPPVSHSHTVLTPQRTRQGPKTHLIRDVRRISPSRHQPFTTDNDRRRQADPCGSPG